MSKEYGCDSVMIEIPTDGQNLRNEIRNFIEDTYHPTGRWTDESAFERLFVDLARFQWSKNLVYQKFVNSQGGIEPIEAWWQVPPVPMRFFKEFELRSYNKHSDERVWHSSGTTGKISKTYLANTRLYDVVIKSLWKRHPSVLLKKTPTSPDVCPLTLRLIPTGKQWPNSSLSHFFDVGQSTEEDSEWIKMVLVHTHNRFTLDFEAMMYYHWKAQESGRPLRIVGTSYAIVQWFEYMMENNLQFTLPAYSSIVDTGGYKGIVKDRTRTEFTDLAKLLVGIPYYFCMNEYGMSEMSSHMWSVYRAQEPQQLGPLEEWWEVPPWVRVRIVNPMTLEDDPNGVVAVYDLANVWSVSALLTEDLGRVHTNDFGIQFFQPLGRARGAGLKGCSIAAERAMEGM